jgi:5-methylcytosine-specific restriction endonuclease McrA
LKEGELRCEYCDKGPLTIYDFTKRKGDPEFIGNKYYKFKEEFKKEDGATCDHKNPQGKGGDKFGYDNLAVCCYRCNQNKKSMSYEDWMKRINKEN